MVDSLHIDDHDRTLVPGTRTHAGLNGMRWSGVIATYESGRQVGYYESGAIFTDEGQAWAWTEQQLAAAELAAQQKQTAFDRDLAEDLKDPAMRAEYERHKATVEQKESDA